MSVPSNSAGRPQAEQLERRHVGKGDRHVAENHRAKLKFVDAGELQSWPRR